MNYFIETYGCQMNVADSELVITILNKKGFQQAKTIEEADVILFNTCSVRQHAEQRVLGRVNNEQRHKLSRNVKIGIIGCMAQRLGDELKKISPAVDFVVGVDQYDKLDEIIKESFSNDFVCYTEVDNEKVYQDILTEHQQKLKAFVTVMRGCNNFCTYCIVPYTRGRERSRKPQEIIEDIKNAAKAGKQEVMLLGQNVNSYKYKDMSFPQLLRKVNEIEGIKRIRFTTSHPKDLSDDLISAMAECDKVCEHFHLAMQSGDNDVLRRMNRGYTSEHYYELVQKLRKAMPDIAITTDVIAGFPGETEEQFQRTMDLMMKIEFDHAYMFKYSPRSGTKAAEYTDQVPEEIRLERLQRMIKQQEIITTRKYQEMTGSIQEVYVESVSRRSNQEVSGKTRDFKVVVFPGSRDLIGKFVKVKIISAVGWTLKGKPLSE